MVPDKGFVLLLTVSSFHMLILEFINIGNWAPDNVPLSLMLIEILYLFIIFIYLHKYVNYILVISEKFSFIQHLHCCVSTIWHLAFGRHS